MNDQKIWLVAAGAGLVVLGVAFLLHGWLHGPRPEPAATIAPQDVAELINEAVAPLQDRLSAQTAELEAMRATQLQLANAVEQSGLREALEEEIAENATQTREGLRADLARYETRLNDLQAQADDPAVANEIAATRAEIRKIEVLLDDLSTRVDCANMAARTNVRTLVIPSRSSLEVPEETVVLSVGRVRNNVIDTVSINARASVDEPVSTRVVGEVPIGSSVEFRHENNNFVAVFTHATRRFLASALVGVELRSTPVALEDCL